LLLASLSFSLVSSSLKSLPPHGRNRTHSYSPLPTKGDPAALQGRNVSAGISVSVSKTPSTSKHRELRRTLTFLLPRFHQSPFLDTAASSVRSSKWPINHLDTRPTSCAPSPPLQSTDSVSQRPIQSSVQSLEENTALALMQREAGSHRRRYEISRPVEEAIMQSKARGA
jgi:hypothetical protein